MNKINLFKHELLKWSKKNRREYSWRNSNDPWKILLLEIIAQQTQLDRANIYYEKFIKKFSKKIPILKAGNMSLGINLLMYLTEIASKSLGNNFLSKVFEAHHKFKKDYPSGTALMLGQGIAIGKNKNFYGIMGKKYLNKKEFI